MRFPALAVSFASIYLAASTAGAADCKGIWSARGQQPHVGDSFASDAVPSPDKKYTLTISEDAIVLTGASGKQAKIDVPSSTALMEIVWSQDSRGFAINESDATNDGPWQTYIYRLDELDAPRLLSIDSQVRKTAAELARCDTKAPTNIALIAWTEKGKQAIVVGETPTLELCKSKAGSFVGFRLSTDTGKLIESMPITSLKEKWADDLGCRLRKN